jgi:hypothetical protein
MNKKLQKSLEKMRGLVGQITREKNPIGVCCNKLMCRDDTGVQRNSYTCKSYVREESCGLMEGEAPKGCTLLRTHFIANTNCTGLNGTCKTIMEALEHKR